MTRVVVVDDHPVFRSGVATLLAASGFDVVGEAASAAEAVDAVRAARPELVVLDLGLPDASGVTALARIVGELPETRVLVLTMFDDDGTVREALRMGAAGYLVKDAGPARIVAALRALAEGATVLGPRLGGAAALVAEPAEDRHGFTRRERDIADLLARGLPNRVIAERLGLAGKTVANNVSSILAKLGVADRIEAARVLRESGGE